MDVGKDTLGDEILVCLRKIIQAIDLHSRVLVKRVGLTGPQLMILMTISKAREISVGEIATAISLRQATVTGILERLEKRGLISRHRSQADRRRVLVQATQPGERILETAPSLLQDSFLEQLDLLAGWEQSMILSALQRVVRMMDASKFECEPILAAMPIENATPGMEEGDFPISQ